MVAPFLGHKKVSGKDYNRVTANFKLALPTAEAHQTEGKETLLLQKGSTTWAGNEHLPKQVQGTEKRKKKQHNMSTQIITFSGNYKSGKSTLALIISQYLAEEKYKILLIDGDLEKSFELLNDLKIMKVEPTIILSLLARDFRIMLQIKNLQKEEKNP